MTAHTELKWIRTACTREFFLNTEKSRRIIQGVDSSDMELANITNLLSELKPLFHSRTDIQSVQEDVCKLDMLIN